MINTNKYGYVIYRGAIRQATLTETKLDKVKLRVYHNDKSCPYSPVNEIYFNWFERDEFLLEEPINPNKKLISLLFM